METDGVSTGDGTVEDLDRLAALGEREHDLWQKIVKCEDDELRMQLFDLLSECREERSKLRAAASLDGTPAAPPAVVAETPVPPRSVGETLRSSLLLPPEEIRAAGASAAPGPTVAETPQPPHPDRESPPPTGADVTLPTGRPRVGQDHGQSSHDHYEDFRRLRTERSRTIPIVASIATIGVLALIVWALFLRPDPAPQAQDPQTTTTVTADPAASSVDQIRAVLDGLGYSSVVIEARSGTVYLGGIVASENDRNSVIGASQALLQDIPLDAGSLIVGAMIESPTNVGDSNGDEPAEQSVVAAPITDGPYIEATLTGKDFVLAGTVPSAELAGQYLQTAEIAYSPYVRSELIVDEQLESTDWLAHGPNAIILLPMMIDGRIVIADGEVQLSGRAPDEAGLERLEGALTQITGLPVVQGDVEIANLEPPTCVITADAGVVDLEGRMPSEEIRTMLVAGATEAYGEGNVNDQLTIDAGVYPALWMYSFGSLMQAMATFPDYELHIDGIAFSGFINGGVTFESNSAVFSGDYAKVLNVGVGVLTRDPSLQLIIEGHTDNLGSTEANLELSQLRAEAVRDYFVAAGIDASRLTAIGIGEAEPVVSNDTAEGRARNRRIQYILSSGS